LVVGASLRAAAISSRLSLEPEPSDCSKLIPYLLAIWRLQASMVADIGAVFGQNGKLSEESIVYCFSRHAAAQFVCELLEVAGERAFARLLSSRPRDGVPETSGDQSSQRLLRAKRGWLPVTAAAAAAYAYSDTRRLGRAAIEFFTTEIEPK
jgi:hypothetical protein